MKINPLLLYCVLILGLTSVLPAQQDSLTYKIEAVSKVKDNQIYLKWMINDPVLWKHALTQGYQLSRTTILRDKEPLGYTEEVVLEEKILPLPLAQWEPIAAQDSIAFVVAQGIYGEEFEVIPNSNSFMDLMMLSEENEQRYAFTLMAMEQSFAATQAAGYGYIDTTAKPNEKYVYTISLLNDQQPPVQKAIVYTGLQNAQDNTPPEMPHGIFGNETVLLVWDHKIQKHLYSAYNIERSLDGQNFKRINPQPIYSWDSRTSAITYQDTLINNTQIYHYRIKGIDAFGEESLPSKVFSGSGIEILEYSPNITDREIKDDQNVRIGWEFPKEAEDKIQEFQILQGTQEDGFFEVVKEKIPPDQRSTWVQTELKASNYFKVKALNADGQFRSSFPTLVQPIDSIPPLPPIELKGEIDTLGIVKLRWKANTEEDLYGYKVFKSNNPDAEFTQLTTMVWKKNEYQDSLALNMLQDKVYYKFIALDQRYNESDFSEVLSLEVPDTAPPSRAVFSDYSVSEEGISLSFIQSTSPDIQKHEIYRRSESETDWSMIHSFEDAQTEFLDTKVEEKVKYYYTLVAIDDKGNESPPSDPLIIRALAPMLSKAIKNFDFKVDRQNRNVEMWWDSNEKNIIEFQLYKRKKGEQYILYRMFEGNSNKRFVDQMVKPGNIYEYSIRALFKEGTLSEFKTIEVQY